MDLVVLGFAAAVLILSFTHRVMWLDWFMGAILVFGGAYFFLIGFGALPRLRSKPTVIPYPVLGAFLIVQGIALGVFHVRF